MLNSERFLNAYASIEKSLNEINHSKRYIPFSQLLSLTSKQSKLVERHYADLKEYNELRNAIVHNRDDEMEIIAEPSNRTVENIEHIAEVLQSGKYALNFASKPVYVIDEKETIQEAFHQMKKANLTKIPVYRNKEFLTLITMEEIAYWGLNHVFQDQCLIEVVADHKQDRAIFIHEKSTISDVITLFEKSIDNKEKTPFIMITKTGDKKEKPLGIISSYDLISILSAML